MNKILMVLILFVFLAACTEKYMVINNPKTIPVARHLEKRPRVALALGGGAFHGIAHVGVLKVLEEANIPIDLIVGTSAGSLVGCMYADHPHADSLVSLINTTKASNVFDFSLLRSKVGFVSGKKLQKFIRGNCKSENIEDTEIPLIVIVTDLLNGKSIALSSGPMAPSVNASCAMPVVFEPVKMYGLTLVDGGVLNSIPTDVARFSGADVVIAVDVMTMQNTAREIDNLTKIGFKAILLMTDQLKTKQLKYADIVIVPDLNDIPYMSGKENQQAYEAGIQAATEMLPNIKEIMKQKGIKIK